MKKGTILGIVVVIWFISSIIAMMWVGETEYSWLMPAIFGQIFCVFSCIFIIPKIKERNFSKVDYLLFVFPLIGIGCIAYSFLKRYGSEKFWSACESFFALIAPFLAVSVFLIVGIILLVAGSKKTIFPRRRCTLKIEAWCIEVKTDWSNSNGRSHITYCPVFEFYYSGQKYKVCDNIFSNVVSYNQGEYYDIYIDPSFPTIFYEPRRNLRIGAILLLLGVSFTSLPLSAIVRDIVSRL